MSRYNTLMKFFLSDEEIEKLAEEMGLKDKESEQLSLFDPLQKSSIQQAGEYISKSFSESMNDKSCEHNWEIYIGLFEKFDHCGKCGKKK